MPSITENNGVIYLLTSPSGKQYVGQSWDYNDRMTQYRRGHHKRQPALHNAIVKYGWDNFAVDVIASGIQDQSTLDKVEDAFIVMLNTLAPHGYNLRRGGDGGKMSDVVRKKMSKSQTGKIKSEDTRLKISRSNKGTKPSAECIAAGIAHNTGKKHSKETRKLMSLAHEGKKHSAESIEKMREVQGKFRDSKIDDMVRMLNSGMTQKSVAYELGVTQQCIIRWMVVAGMKPVSQTQREFRDANIERVISMLASGMTRVAIAKEVGISRPTISVWEDYFYRNCKHNTAQL